MCKLDAFTGQVLTTTGGASRKSSDDTLMEVEAGMELEVGLGFGGLGFRV